MDQVTVTLEGKDHKIFHGEHTVCGLPVPHGTTREDGAKECKTCFAADPEAVEDPRETEPFSLAVEPETLGHYENPDAKEGEPGYIEPEEPKKPAAKATKAK